MKKRREEILTIGMPVYNGSKYIERALRSLIEQDFGNWILLIADNNSTDNTKEIVDRFSRFDNRIILLHHKQNIGATRNFLFLTEQAKSSFFMWAAADDEWSSNYISSCLSILKSDEDIGFVSGGVINIDDEGKVLRKYDSFSVFSSVNVKQRIDNYLQVREVDGKANMIYSVFRTSILQSVCKIPDIFEGWGSDMALVLAVLARVKYKQSIDASLFKRVVSESDIQTSCLLADNKYNAIQYQGHYPPSLFRSYTNALKRGMPNKKLKGYVQFQMLKRHVLIFISRLSKFNFD